MGAGVVARYPKAKAGCTKLPGEKQFSQSSLSCSLQGAFNVKEHRKTTFWLAVAGGSKAARGLTEAKAIS